MPSNSGGSERQPIQPHLRGSGVRPIPINTEEGVFSDEELTMRPRINTSRNEVTFQLINISPEANVHIQELNAISLIQQVLNEQFDQPSKLRILDYIQNLVDNTRIR